MKSIQDILKITALLYLLAGSLMIFLPNQTNIFFNETMAIPDVVILLSGIGLNLSGILMLQVSKQKQIGHLTKITLSLIQLLWIIAATTTLVISTWVTIIDGITVIGLWIIICSWLLWYFYQSQPRKNTKH